jgi:hypothetical protein
MSKNVDQASIGSLANLEPAVVRAALEKVLAGFLAPSFAALPKGEYELLILDVLIDLGRLPAEPTEYDLISLLRVKRGKARTLLYDRELRRSSGARLDELLRCALERARFQKAADGFALEVDNPLVIDHLRYRVRELGHLADGSFSPSVVKLSLNAVTALLESMLPPAVLADMRRALVAAGAPDTSFRGVLKQVLTRAGSRFAADAGEAVAEKTFDLMSSVVRGAVPQLTALAKQLFAPNDATA